MIDISEKPIVSRCAVAKGEIKLRKETIEAISKKTVKKGDVLTCAKVACISAVKNTSQLIPFCHQIPLSSVKVDFDLKESSIICKCEVKAEYKTGVELEALVGVTTALLTIWDLVKYLEKDKEGQYPFTRITNIEVTRKEKKR
ncbi:MAG: cyclic pyranopterin monophosphate synthase MoaC [Candidatus Thermoplasmatota archaeon]|nr:cyclic pyranopterin monophosphate synthase MoaC [Candidatus Thermoplasmatota archaeon]MDI6855408.1 cyclic pyranopterin monophosphate synthase MoaC [Candidatus Thermoplasmatota archaeon]